MLYGWFSAMKWRATGEAWKYRQPDGTLAVVTDVQSSPAANFGHAADLVSLGALGSCEGMAQRHEVDRAWPMAAAEPCQPGHPAGVWLCDQPGRGD